MIQRALAKIRSITSKPYRVIDNVLVESELKDLQSYYKNRHAAFARLPDSSPIWTKSKADPEEETNTYFWISPKLTQEEAARQKIEVLRKRGVLFNPFGSPMDAFANAVVPHVRDNGRTCGKEGRDWLAMMFKSYSYGPGSFARWHSDGRKYSGAFVFYYHDEWQQDWGGNLLMASHKSFTLRSKPRLDRGTFLVPQTNRLVLIGPETMHMVERVSPMLSPPGRLSVAGFLMTPKSVYKTLEAVSETIPSDTKRAS